MPNMPADSKARFFAYYAEEEHTRRMEFKILTQATLEEAKLFIQREFFDSDANVTLIEFTRKWTFKTEHIVKREWSE
jgi:hypothetical protein